MLILRRTPATLFMIPKRDFDKEVGRSNWLARRFFINLHSLAIVVAWEQDETDASFRMDSATCGKDLHMTYVSEITALLSDQQHLTREPLGDLL
jgi:hypothetical protein